MPPEPVPAPEFPGIFNPFRFGEDPRLSRAHKSSAILKPTPEHQQVIALHMNGMGTAAIAKVMNRKYSWVAAVLRDDTIKGILDRIREVVNMELAALYPLAVNAVREVLEDGSDGPKLKAAELVLRTQGKMDGEDSRARTAEDVVEEIMTHVEVEGKAVISIAGRRVIHHDSN